ncbi:MAG: retroviral-like aspartic protease family protein [Nitrospirota bacterium]|nr:retroviral-like aspartic protease family protein [Nitrospirota bacterium]
MNLSVLMILLIMIPNISFADSSLSFTDQDLTRYKKSSDITRPPESSAPSANSVQRTDMLSADRNKKPGSFEVPYKAYEGIARRVIISVKFNDAETAPMLLDTGSPGMIISYELADKLGLFRKDNARLITAVGGIGGTAPGIISIIDSVQIGEARDYFIPVTISASLSDHFEGLVGMDFMANFSVKVDTRKKVVLFEEIPRQDNMPGGHDEEWWRITFYQFATLRNDWMNIKKNLDAWINKQKNGQNLSGRDEVPALRSFVESQCAEADKLFDKLNGYAIRNSVPMQWRKY